MTLRHTVPVECGHCGGTGDVHDADGRTLACGACLGSGRVYDPAPFPELAELSAAHRPLPSDGHVT